MDLRTLTDTELQAFEGQAIADLCATGLTDAALNHCAHFVSHALDIGIGMRCGDMSYRHRGTGASIRVNDVFNYCTERGPWADRPTDRNALLIFVTLTDNVSSASPPIMGTQSRKHIGIAFGNDVRHYSNGQDLVIRETVAEFEARFRRNYGAGIALYYGYRVDI